MSDGRLVIKTLSDGSRVVYKYDLLRQAGAPEDVHTTDVERMLREIGLTDVYLEVLPFHIGWEIVSR